MKDWDYTELFEAINEIYENALNTKRGDRYAVARTFYEFESVLSDGPAENIIVHTALGEKILDHEEVFSGNLNAIKRTLNSFSFEALTNELTKVELEDLAAKVSRVLLGIDKIPVNHNPNAETHI